MPKRLTKEQKEIIFVKEYIKDFNGTRAAIEAGYSEKSARSAASRMLTNNNIQKLLNDELKARVDRTEIDADQVLYRLHDIEKMDFTVVFDDNNNIKPLSEWPEKIRSMVKDFKLLKEEHNGSIRTQILSVKFMDKDKALELKGKHTKVNAFTENVKVDHGDVTPWSTISAGVNDGRA